MSELWISAQYGVRNMIRSWPLREYQPRLALVVSVGNCSISPAYKLFDFPWETSTTGAGWAAAWHDRSTRDHVTDIWKNHMKGVRFACEILTTHQTAFPLHLIEPERRCFPSLTHSEVSLRQISCSARLRADGWQVLLPACAPTLTSLWRRPTPQPRRLPRGRHTNRAAPSVSEPSHRTADGSSSGRVQTGPDPGSAPGSLLQDQALLC